MPIVGHVAYAPTNLKLPVRFTEKTGRFTCTFSNVQYENTSFELLRAEVSRAIEAASSIEWAPVIALIVRALHAEQGDTSTISHNSTSLYLVRERKYIGFHTTSEYKQVSWDTQPEHRLKASRPFPWDDIAFTPPTHKETFEGRTIYLPYTEETWNAIVEIQQYLSLASSLISKRTTSPEGIYVLLETCRSLFDHAATQDEEEG